MEWNKKQAEAIYTRGKNLLVAAAAGSGKTAVLVERIRRIVVDERVPVRQLLVLTFTNAAAAEMKEKIRKSLMAESSRLQRSEPQKAAELRRQIRELANADISTFHSFGMNILKRFFYLAEGLEPGFSVCDDTRSSLMKEDALDDLFDRKFADGDESFLKLMDHYCGDRNPRGMRSLIKSVHERLMAMPHPWEWAYNEAKACSVTPEEFAAGGLWKAIRDDMKNVLAEALRLDKQLADTLDNGGMKKLAAKLYEDELPLYERALELLNELSSDPVKALYDVSEVLSVRRPSLKPSNDEKPVYYGGYNAEVGAIRDYIKKSLIDPLKKAYLNVPAEDMLKDMAGTEDMLTALTDLTKEFDLIYAGAKRKAGVVDFNDIEHFALDILEHDEAASFYRERFSNIFIDEYQDTNITQEAIINRIRRENNMFMVGDIKQSIYRFRLADPDIFAEKYRRYKCGGDKDSMVIDLNVNYRSKDRIVRAINAYFEGLMSDYDEDARLHTGLACVYPDLESEPELHVINMQKRKDEDDTVHADDEIEELKDKELEALHVAGIIRDNLGREFYDSKEGCVRSLVPGDIVILMRAVKGTASVFCEMLKLCGINCLVDDNEGYFETMEIDIFMNLLSVIDNGHQDIPLISVLHSAIFGFDASELATVRAMTPGGMYADAFAEYACSGQNAALRERCASVFAAVQKWRTLASSMPLPEYIWRLLLESGHYLIMGAMPDGERRQANLRALVDRAKDFSKDRQATLYNFLRYVGAMRQRQIKTAEAGSAGGERDAVRIMTIHKSKGLEFPMVIVSRLGAGRQNRDDESTVSIHKDLGMGLKLVDRDERWSKKTLVQTAVGRRKKSEERQEEIRILYVAMTRARDMLYLTGTVKDADKWAASTGREIREAGSYLQMIAPNAKYKMINKSDLCFPPSADAAADSDIYDGVLSDRAAGRIRTILGFKYPFEEARGSKSKYSVTELNAVLAGGSSAEGLPGFPAVSSDAAISSAAVVSSDTAVSSDAASIRGISSSYRHISYIPQIPAFVAGGRRLTAAQRGTVYHEIMEHADFAEAHKLGLLYIKAVTDKLIDGGLIDASNMDQIDLTRITAFFDTPLGKRAASASAAGRLRKETPFTMKLADVGNVILVQGVIDCWFSDENGTVLIDYKSNAINDEKDAEEEDRRLADKYRGQLVTYRDALNKAGFGPVKNAYLYLFAVGRFVEI